MKPLISIIIPVYNVEQYLRKCLESCINQTLNEIEIIVVNDCSPDNSHVIMREYEEKYPEIIKCIYLKENFKLGGARNKGVEIAQGDYIIFVDSDDYIASNMCEELYKSACSNDADVVISDYFRVVDEYVSVKSSFANKIESCEDINKNVIIENHISASAWGRLYKKEVIIKNLISEKIFYEDLRVTLIWLLKASKINYISKPFYNYVYRGNSIVGESNYFSDLQLANAIIELCERLKKEKLFEKYYFYLAQYILKELSLFLNRYIIRFLDYNCEKVNLLIEYIKNNISNWEEILNQGIAFNKYEKYLLNKILTENNYIEKLYLKSKDKIVELFKTNNIAIWGSGIYGKSLLSYFSKFNQKPICIFDNNKNLHGTYLDGILIDSFEKNKNKCNVIIIGIRDYDIFNQIKSQIVNINPNIKVMYFVDLFKYE